jgi:hypothetical protein
MNASVRSLWSAFENERQGTVNHETKRTMWTPR